MHKRGKKEEGRKEVDVEKRMDGFIRRGCWPFNADKGQVYISFQRSRQVKTACGAGMQMWTS